MPVNTNDLRDMASEFRETTFTKMVIEAANQLDSTRTERNILRAELDAAREELREVREAALSALGLLDDPSCPVTGLDETRRARAILAEALAKDATT
jgi:ATPase subunit of ABC transporter with duplicated ATPase domains